MLPCLGPVQAVGRPAGLPACLLDERTRGHASAGQASGFLRSVQGNGGEERRGEETGIREVLIHLETIPRRPSMLSRACHAPPLFVDVAICFVVRAYQKT